MTNQEWRNKSDSPRNEFRDFLYGLAMVTVGGIGIICIGGAISAKREASRAIRMIDSAAESISDIAYGDISECVVNRAVEKAANKHVSDAVSRIRESCAEAITKRANEMVSQQVASAKEEIAKILAKQASDIAINELADCVYDDVVENVSETISDYIKQCIDKGTLSFIKLG